MNETKQVLVRIDPRDATRLRRAPLYSIRDGQAVKMDEEASRNLGFRPFVPVGKPVPGEGMAVRLARYELRDANDAPVAARGRPPADAVVKPVWEVYRPARTFSKLKLYAALSKAGLWDGLRTWLEEQTVVVDGVELNAWTAFSLAQELKDDHPLFASFFASAKTALGVSDETADALLAECLA